MTIILLIRLYGILGQDWGGEGAIFHAEGGGGTRFVVENLDECPLPNNYVWFCYTPMLYKYFFMWPGRFTDLSCLPTTSSNSKHVFTLGQTLIRAKFCQVVKLMRQIWLCLIPPKILLHWFEYRYKYTLKKQMVYVWWNERLWKNMQ